MRAAYERMSDYTIVLTPHAIQAWVSRFAKSISKNDVIDKIDDVRHKLRPNQVSGTSIMVNGITVAYIYLRRIFNEQREREEVEAISMTPADHFNTSGRNENGISHMTTVMV